MVLDILFGIAIISMLTLGYTTWNQMQKVERLEDWIENYSSRIVQTKTILDELDSEGKFEADDQVGTVFKGIQDAIDDLTTITEKEI